MNDEEAMQKIHEYFRMYEQGLIIQGEFLEQIFSVILEWQLWKVEQAKAKLSI